MFKQFFNLRSLGLLAALFITLSAATATAQTTQFTYQGRLTDSSLPANGSYDFQFKLYDALMGGMQIGSALVREDVAVNAGVFTVTLDFGATSFSGANRFLEIGVRPGVSMGAFTTLSPLQQVNATPYAIRSLNATSADGLSVACINCVTSGQIGSLPGGSGNYIQNSTALQAASNFNISGNGTAGGTLGANIVNATTQYNAGGNRILSNPGTNNLFAGIAAGQANTTGSSNAFFGRSAGANNTSGYDNAFFGYTAGVLNTTGNGNAIFGAFAGTASTTSNNNAIFGAYAGRFTTGFSNAFAGTGAGTSNTTGYRNSFFGEYAGITSTTGNNNTLLGAGADVGTSNLSYATAVGAGAVVASRNTVMLGRTADTIRISGVLNLANGGEVLFENKWRTETTTVNAPPILGPPNLIGGFLGTGSGGATPGNRVTTGVVGASIGGGGFNGTLNYPSGGSEIGDNSNRVTDWFGTVGGGFGNRAGNDDTTLVNANFATVGGGYKNTASGLFATVSGGQLNNAGGQVNMQSKINSTVGGGGGNNANNSHATVGGGYTNTASGISTTVAGGQFNTASGDGATVGGGSNNTASGAGSVIPGGFNNVASASDSLAAGNGAKALHQGAFVWADSDGTTKEDFASTDDNQFLIRAAGGVGVGTNSPLDLLHVAGNIRLGKGGLSCVKGPDGAIIVGTCSSDLRFKHGIQSFPALLGKIVSLRPVTFYWRASEFPDRHFGVQESFGLIAQEVEVVLPELVTTDEQGYKAINYSKLPLLTLQAVKELKAENDALNTRLAVLEQLLQQQHGNAKQQCAKVACSPRAARKSRRR